MTERTAVIARSTGVNPSGERDAVTAYQLYEHAVALGVNEANISLGYIDTYTRWFVIAEIHSYV
jgi:hypothetical protein